MRARPGDEMRIHSGHVGTPDRTGEILEIRGPDGGPPYLVRWDDNGHTTLFFPGMDALVVPIGESNRVVS